MDLTGHSTRHPIRRFYGEPDPEWFIDRPYPYPNESTMARIVEDTVRGTLIILEKIKYTNIGKVQSSSEILPQEFMLPYQMPL